MGEQNKRKITKKRIKEAKKRFDKSTRGSEEERAKELLEINSELRNTRRRANKETDRKVDSRKIIDANTGEKLYCIYISLLQNYKTLQ